MKNFITKTLATGFGTGYFPFASGTVGSLIGILLYIALIQFTPLQMIHIAFALIICIIGIPVSTKAEKLFGKKDPGTIVIDEIAGCLVFLAFSPELKAYGSFIYPPIWYLISGFLLFRIFDILKPYPANKLQALNGGTGVMADDIIAGIYTALVLKVYIVIKYLFILK